jgi:hypothetical protein
MRRCESQAKAESFTIARYQVKRAQPKIFSDLVIVSDDISRTTDHVRLDRGSERLSLLVPYQDIVVQFIVA